MARIFKNIDNTGFSASTATEGARIMNSDGTPNIRKTGMSFITRTSIYHTLLRMPRARFFLIVFGWYTLLNLLFASIYYMIGVEHLAGMEPGTSAFKQFTEAFFFSSQTLTTVGYGHLAPNGLITNIVASMESFLGILMFALVTGIFYGRFSRPKAYLIFGEHILVAPYKDGRALMVRVASYKNNHLTDLEAIMTAAIHVIDGDKRTTRFYTLQLEISRLSSLALSWTVVHALDENSPLYGLTEQDLRTGRLEVILSVKGFDDHFSNTVQQRTSYISGQLVYGAKFQPMFRQAEEGTHTVLELDRIGAYEKVPLPEPALATA
jgi:inward rectifier potassium channel